MASILRSSKFFRYFAGFARNVIFNTADGSVIHKSQFLSTSSISKVLAIPAVEPPPQNNHDSTLEKSLRRLDQDVRRSGRISRRELEEILEELRQSNSATSSQSLLIIRCCGNLVPEESPEVRTRLVEEIWNTLGSLGVPMDVSHYNALLRVYLENEHQFSPTQFLSDLERKGIEPNRVTYQRLIARYCQQADIDGATGILEFMREKQLPVNESVFNALIMGHSQADDMQSALGILGVMSQAGLEPSADTYTTLLCAHAKRGDMEAIDATILECNKKEVYLLDKDFMDVLYSLVTNGHVTQVDKIMSHMRQSMGYNHDAMNLVLRLVNIGQSQVALKVLETMPRPTLPDGQNASVGAFFIRQLVKSQQPLNEMLAICDQLETSGLNQRALLIATERSLQLGNADQAFALFQAMQSRDLPIRQHYFWPLLAACVPTKDVKAMMKVLEKMIVEFQISPTSETLRDHVIPHLPRSMTSDQMINELRSAGVSPASAACALVTTLLQQQNMAEAALVAGRYRAHYPPGLLRRSMSTCFMRTGDVASYIKLLRLLYDACGQDNNPTDLIGNFVLDVAIVTRKERGTAILALLQGLVNEGLGMSNGTAVRLQERLADDMTTEISTLLDQLTGGDLKLQPTTNTQAYLRFPQMDVSTLEKLRLTLESKGESTLGVRKQLLAAYCRSRDLVKAEAIKASLDTEQEPYVYSGGILAQLMELYAHHDMLEQALQCKVALGQIEPAFSLDHAKVIKLASLLIKNDRLADGIQLLKEHGRSDDKPVAEATFSYTTLCWRLLNSLAEAAKLDQLKQVFNVLLEHQYITVTNVLLGPLVKAHIIKGDLAGAMTEFEHCCHTHRSTPWKNELACKLILAEDAVSLQRLTDLSTGIHGEVNSLYDLVFAFVECGRIRQAKKILQTPGLGSRPQRIASACERYRQEGQVAPLEGLVAATKDIAHIVDRSQIYMHLLLAYSKSNEVDKAMGLWTNMQEEDVAVTDDFLISLAKLLKANGQDVPFLIPAAVTKTTPKAPISSKKSTSVTSTTITSKSPGSTDTQTTATSQFRKAMKAGQLAAVLEVKQKAEEQGEKLTVTDLSNLIELLVKKERLQEATDLVLKMLEDNVHPLPRIFRFLLNRLANTGAVDAIKLFNKYLSDENKKILSFDNRLCYANVVAGKAAIFLSDLQEEINQAKEDDLPMLAAKFPKGGSIAILQQHPELLRQFEDMARTYAVRGIISPINVLWMHLFVDQKESEAGQLWSEFLSRTPLVMFAHVVQTARKTEDVELATRLVNQLVGTAVSEGGVGNAYSCLIDILVAKEKHDEALSTLENAIKNVCLENLNATALTRLSNGLKANGKTFPYNIPSKKATKVSSSDSSSSDEDNSMPRRSN